MSHTERYGLTRKNMSSYVIAISGPSGAGKTTLVKKVVALLGNATAIYYDNYQRITRWHPDIRQWVEQGCDPNQFASIPQLTQDVYALREGRAVQDPKTEQMIEPAPYVVLEEPWGRDRDELAPFIDFVAHLDIPLDISLCRKILREATRPNSPLDPLDFLRFYLANRVSEAYQRQLQVGKHADLVLDGLRPPEDLAVEIVEEIHKRNSHL